MAIIFWIIFGGLVGWLASILMKSSNQSLITDILIGIVGAMIGGFLFNLLGAPGVTGFNIYSIIVAVIGASVLIFLTRMVLR
ncbi:MAG TPA: GlsB/YeaQ/YmgE family stress response membrane protein [Patescibacteria group bacterium]